MNHKFGTYETSQAPCQKYCANTVTVGGHVFGKDQIENYLFSFLSARVGLTLGTTRIGAQFVAKLHGQLDFPDDQAAYADGYAYGMHPSLTFSEILQGLNVRQMQNDVARRGWPSSETAQGTTSPTWGGAHGGLGTPEEEGEEE